jgi:hypothetical protein
MDETRMGKTRNSHELWEVDLLVRVHVGDRGWILLYVDITKDLWPIHCDDGRWLVAQDHIQR